jgi:hypothetical protein
VRLALCAQTWRRCGLCARSLALAWAGDSGRCTALYQGVQSKGIKLEDNTVSVL